MHSSWSTWLLYTANSGTLLTHLPLCDLIQRETASTEEATRAALVIAADAHQRAHYTAAAIAAAAMAAADSAAATRLTKYVPDHAYVAAGVLCVIQSRTCQSNSRQASWWDWQLKGRHMLACKQAVTLDNSHTSNSL
jgi:hypothetical protein